MQEQQPRRLQVWTPLLFSLIMIAGMVLGFNLRDTLRNKREITTIIERNDRLEQIIDLIREKYVDSVNTNVLYEDAVNGIISHLDPHTIYIAPDQLASVNEDLEGSFFGIGVEFSILKDTIQVTSVLEEGPSERAGVETGDQLIKVGDSTVAGNGITTDRIVKMLRGKQHSQVVVTLRAASNGKLKNIIIERDAVPIYSIEASLMLDSLTGYIKINRFAATTFSEFQKAMKALKAKGMKQLVIDVRQNPGGYLDAATMISDELLDGDKLIVYTKGRQSPKEEYHAGEPGAFEQGKLAVLIDEGSASASEILAGAIQDWDRGVIIGRRSFGKGLVQEQFEMDNGAALRLTTARYYTPSGRSIQRTYSLGRDAYEKEIASRIENEAYSGRDSVVTGDTVKYFTSRKRPVFGGGGITPDIYVPYDTARLSSGLVNILYGDQLRNTLWDYFVRNKEGLKAYKTIADYSKQYNIDEVINAYLQVIPQPARGNIERMLRQPGHKAYFYTQVKAQLARLLFRNNGFYSIAAAEDHVLQAAIRSFRTPQYSSVISR